MEKSYYEMLKSGLEDAVAFSKGDTSRCRVIEVEIPDPVPAPAYKAADVVRTRQALNLTQRALAKAMGVPTETVEEWENGKVEPSGIAIRFLFLLDGDHSLVDRLTALQ